MLRISIIIVNYNVELFLEQCLVSVQKAVAGISSEIFVVDNDSADNSVAMVKARFPSVKLIANHENKGFAKANNQAIRQAQGEYILLLNPDTIIKEDTLSKTLQFMDEHDEAGGLGVKMIDGNGRFLPESKRGVPTPLVAFYKMTGLSRLFPRSEKFNKYHLGHLDPDQTHEIDVLSGAFMLLRKSVLEITGYLDEDYFMYGEDIDLSCRISQAGYRNYYLAETTIIHFKGESTRKGTLNYVILFYRAMYIFTKKQLTTSHSRIFLALISFAIYLRAILSLINRILAVTWLPVFDLVAIYLATCTFSHNYAEYWKGSSLFYPEILYSVILPAYSIIWVIILAAGRCYEERYKPARFAKSILYGSAGLFILYALLPESIRFSRAIMIFGSVFSLVFLGLIRFIASTIPFSGITYRLPNKYRYIVVGDEAEVSEITESLIKTCNTDISDIFGYSPAKENADMLVEKISERVKKIKPDEIFFFSNSVSYSNIIKCIIAIKPKGIKFKIIDTNSTGFFGTNDTIGNGHNITTHSNNIFSTRNRLKKRTFDIVFSTCCLISFPFAKRITGIETNFGRKCYSVLTGQKTWVSIDENLTKDLKLPFLKPGIVTLNTEKNPDRPNREILRYIHAYSLLQDISILLNNQKKQLSD